ncbi:MAG: 3-deoxy-D-manno-octulosonic acid kinase, partial [Pseudomonadota bacterium]
MKPSTVQKGSSGIVYDADALPDVDDALFDVARWRASDALEGSAPGRGTSWFIESPAGPAVLRRYLRGGMVARFNRDRYLFRGFKASRPFREFDVLRRMAEDGLPVPAPLAALCERDGAFYRAALLTQRIAPARALADHFADADFDWRKLGRELGDLFAAGMNHADLNARNILIHGASGAAWVIDLDASRYTP